MLFANDYNDNRVYIDDIHSNKEYYCPYCGATLITKKGDIRKHHFAHRSHHVCSDTWEQEHSYDTSEWHNEWQNRFPKANQEIKLTLGETIHRADILVSRTVIEFQHSIMSAKSFDDRNNFYFNLAYKVVWLFDVSDLFTKRRLTYEYRGHDLLFCWKNPKKAFNSYDVKYGCIDLFFQIKDTEKKCIVRVKNVSEMGFEMFTSTDFIDKIEFLEYVGLNNGNCLAPDTEYMEINKRYLRFKEKYNIFLNHQQERAVQAVEGANLLLAVPGSGKTTVLVARLGYMIFEKGINPQNILAITFNKDAAYDMKKRFLKLFSLDIKKSVEFRTINSLCYSIYKNYCKKKGRSLRKIIEDKEHRKILANVYKECNEGKFATESDITELRSTFSYIKNMMMSDEQIGKLNEIIPNLSQMYFKYTKEVKSKYYMDFDDQMVFAFWILSNDADTLYSLRRQFTYICVDEAQDTSKIQHKIIQLIVGENNIFMVGDEDQSIYGFRAAYPKALLNFKYDYRNPYILRMERNYRSTNQIVEKAQKFISCNKGRYEKNMVAERDNGKDVELISVKSRSDQYKYLLDIAKNHNYETAFLYRDNESAVVLIDLFLRNNIPFRQKKPEMNFFGNKVVKDIVAYLKLSLNEFDAESFEYICNKGLFYLKAKPKQWAIKKCKTKHISVYDAAQEQMQYVEYRYRHRAEKFRSNMYEISKSSSIDAITLICDEGYGLYIQDKNYDYGKIEILKVLAKQEPDIKKFLFRLSFLESKCFEGFNPNDTNTIVLSTIHSSKGLEYNNVYMIDIYDGRFPSSAPSIIGISKDNADGMQEERRLFYVGITRAKNNLYIMNIEDKRSSFVEELFSDLKEKMSPLPTAVCSPVEVVLNEI